MGKVGCSSGKCNASNCRTGACHQLHAQGNTFLGKHHWQCEGFTMCVSIKFLGSRVANTSAGSNLPWQEIQMQL